MYDPGWQGRFEEKSQLCTCELGRFEEPEGGTTEFQSTQWKLDWLQQEVNEGRDRAQQERNTFELET